MTNDKGEKRGGDDEPDGSAVLVPGWLVRPVLITAMLSIPGGLTWFWRLESRNASMDTRVSALEDSADERRLEAQKTHDDIAQMKTDVAVIRAMLENLQTERRLQSVDRLGNGGGP